MEDDRAVDGGGESLRYLLLGAFHVCILTIPCVRQLACADVILLNKVDLVPEHQILSTEELLHQVNPGVPVYRTIQGQIDLSLVMGIMAYASPPSFQKATPAPLSDAHQDGRDATQDASHNQPTTHYESRGISSLQITCPVLSPSHLDRLDKWIS